MITTSEIARMTGMETEPVAITWTSQKPESALEFRQGSWGCVMWLYAKVAKEGRTALFDRETCGCAGGAIGLGLGRPFDRHSARTKENFCCFLSNGILGAENREEFAAVAEQAAGPRQKKMLLEGERLMKTPAVVRQFLEHLPVYDIPERYVVMKPLSQVKDGETIRSVVFLADPDQVSALSILANYEDGTILDRVTVAAGAAGCQAMGICTYAEEKQDRPRAVIGLTDITARAGVRKLLGKNVLTFSVPYRLFESMERNVPGSFLESDAWKELRATEGGAQQ